MRNKGKIKRCCSRSAGLLMTTKAMAAEKPKKEKPLAPTMPPDDMN